MASLNVPGNLGYVDPFTGEATGNSTVGLVGTGSGFLGSRVRFLSFTGIGNGDTFTVNLGSVLGVGWFGGTGATTNQCLPTFAMSQTTDGQWQTTITFNTPGGGVVGMLCIVSAN